MAPYIAKPAATQPSDLHNLRDAVTQQQQVANVCLGGGLTIAASGPSDRSTDEHVVLGFRNRNRGYEYQVQRLLFRRHRASGTHQFAAMRLATAGLIVGLVFVVD